MVEEDVTQSDTKSPAPETKIETVEVSTEDGIERSSTEAEAEDAAARATAQTMDASSDSKEEGVEEQGRSKPRRRLSRNKSLDLCCPGATMNKEKLQTSVRRRWSIDKSKQQQPNETPPNTPEEAKQGEEKVELDSGGPSPAEKTEQQAETREELGETREEEKPLEKNEDEIKQEDIETENAQEESETKKEEKKQPSTDTAAAKEEPSVEANKERKEQPSPERGRPAPASPRQQQQQQHALPRLHPPPNSNASTEIVHSLFGPSVGICWGDFSCQYNHVRGRLYASTEAVLFYSNIFGFEKKINLNYEDVFQMSLYRQTSIQVTVQEDENKNDESNNEAAVSEYVFKGFSDRTQTLQLLIELWRQSQGADNDTQQQQQQQQEGPPEASENPQESASDLLLATSRSLSPTLGPLEANERPTRPTSILKTSKAATGPSNTRGSPTRVDTSSSTTNPMLPDIPSRKRSKSVPNLHRRRPKERSKSQGAAVSTSTPVAADEDFNWNETPTKNDLGAWEAAKQSAGPWVKEVGVESAVLPCSLSTFYKLFLANDAEFSIDKYQRGDEVKDLDVKVTPWGQDPSEPKTLVRTIDFRHPCASFGVGPSHAPTKKHQRLHRYPGCGICMLCSTYVEGLPGSDCFVVEDIWLVEAMPNSNNPKVKFSTRFGANFFKRTFLKSIIQKNIKTGSKEWFVGYRKMVQSAVKENLHLEEFVEEAPPSDVPALEKKEAPRTKFDEPRPNTSDPFQQLSFDGRIVLVAMVGCQVLLLLFLVFVVNELRRSHRAAEDLMQEMKLLRLEHGKVLGLLLEGQQPLLEE